MADFHQGGMVTTLHRLNERDDTELEAELKQFSKSQPLGLILPSLFSELKGDALEGIVEQLSSVEYLDQIVIGLDRADIDEYRYACNYFSRLPQHHRVLWNDGPRLKALDEELQQAGLAPTQMGKGRNVWYCLGYILASGRVKSVALHDCDILTYQKSLLSRLIYPVAHPQFNYAFCKGYYARVANGALGGRVSRLFVSPLLRSLKRVCGYNDYIEYLDSFRYPLAGEFSMKVDVIPGLRIPSDWGLEVGVLSEMYRDYSTNRICQVDIADVYDHKHQSLSADDDSQGLSKMSVDIAKAIFRKMATQGEVFSSERFRSIKACYYRAALDFVDSYQNDALINGLKHDRHREEQAIESFAKNIISAGDIFLDRPMEKPFIPSWSRVISAKPEILDRLLEAVEEDHRELSAPLRRVGVAGGM